MASIRVLLFARLADVVGSREVELPIGEGLTASDAYRLLAREHPGLAPLEGRVMYAINAAYAGRDDPLSPGDELALIPPVSGGSRAL